MIFTINYCISIMWTCSDGNFKLSAHKNTTYQLWTLNYVDINDSRIIDQILLVVNRNLMEEILLNVKNLQSLIHKLTVIYFQTNKITIQ